MEENIDIGIDMDVDVGVVELATLIGSGFLMLLKMVTTTTNLLLFWEFCIKRLESMIRVWLAEGRVQSLPESGARNIKLTDDMQAFIKEEQEKLYNSLSPPSPQLVRKCTLTSRGLTSLLGEAKAVHQ